MLGLKTIRATQERIPRKWAACWSYPRPLNGSPEIPREERCLSSWSAPARPRVVDPLESLELWQEPHKIILPALCVAMCLEYLVWENSPLILDGPSHRESSLSAYCSVPLSLGKPEKWDNCPDQQYLVDLSALKAYFVEIPPCNYFGFIVGKALLVNARVVGSNCIPLSAENNFFTSLKSEIQWQTHRKISLEDPSPNL